MRYLGIDYGSKRVGLAISDENGQMGFPHDILPNNPDLLKNIVKLIQERGIGGIVMGESLNFAQEQNPIAHDAKAFATKLSDATGIAVSFESETLTSREARRMHEPSEKTRKPANHDRIDDAAAALILTSFLSRPKS